MRRWSCTCGEVRRPLRDRSDRKKEKDKQGACQSGGSRDDRPGQVLLNPGQHLFPAAAAQEPAVLTGRLGSGMGGVGRGRLRIDPR